MEARELKVGDLVVYSQKFLSNFPNEKLNHRVGVVIEEPRLGEPPFHYADDKEVLVYWNKSPTLDNPNVEWMSTLSLAVDKNYLIE